MINPRLQAGVELQLEKQGYLPKTAAEETPADEGVDLRQAADQGDVEAQNHLGLMYAYGEGVPQDDAEAAKWWRKAADNGFPVAQYNLAMGYASGDGVTRDHAEAVKWFRMAAEQGDAQAQSKLSVMLEYGMGVPKDKAEAKKWHRKAYSTNSPEDESPVETESEEFPQVTWPGEADSKDR